VIVFSNISKWKNYEVLLKSYPLFIYRRRGFEIENSMNANITLLDAPLLEISSTHIRELLKSGKSARYLLPDVVYERNRKK